MSDNSSALIPAYQIALKQRQILIDAFVAATYANDLNRLHEIAGQVQLHHLRIENHTERKAT